MFRSILLFTVILTLLTGGLSDAQVYTAISRDLIVGLDVRPLFTKQTIELRGNQIETNFSKTRVEFSGHAISAPGWFRAKVAVVPGLSFSETVTPIKTLQIGAVDFGPKMTQGGQQQSQSTNQKPVEISFSDKTSWRFELSGPMVMATVRPLLILDGAQCELTAEGEKDGKKTRETEAFNQTFWGLGGSLRYRQGDNLTELSLAGSDRYFRLESSVSQMITPRLGLVVGYYHQTQSWENFKRKNNGSFINIIFTF